MLLVLAVLVLVQLSAGQTPEPALPRGAEAVSLLGKPLYPPPIAPEAKQELERKLEEARQQHEKNKRSADATIWLGRRTAYLGRFREAIDIYTNGIAAHRTDARMYRHRAHRYITTRRFDLAIEDLSRAAGLVLGKPDEIEPDGQPNARNLPRSTLQTNIWYHLGLAHYLRGDFARARHAYLTCLDLSKNPDMFVATGYWLYLTLRRLDRPVEARQVLDSISAGMEVIENGAYYRLLLMYKGELTPGALASGSSAVEDAATAYGIAIWHVLEGRRDEGVALLRKILDGQQWPAFGYIAAEAELVRIGH